MSPQLATATAHIGAIEADRGYGVWIRQLSLSRFRSYESADIALDNKAVVLVGANGSGKSNMLEAISLLAPGRGMRRAKSDHWPHQPTTPSIASHDESGWQWAVSADIAVDDTVLRAGTGQSAGAARRAVRLNGTPASQNQLAECIAVSWLTPDMDAVLAASPRERRRFLDRLVIAFDAAHAGRLSRYEKGMRERNKILEGEVKGDGAWLDAIEQDLATTGVAICAARLALTAALNAESAIPQPLFPTARLSLHGEVEDWLATMPAIDAEDRMRRLAAERRDPAAASMPGPHNTLCVAVHSATGREGGQSSTGEVKALLISIILAHARLQAKRLVRPPILLLDDITAHLDDGHRQALFDLTAELGGQVWFTATDAGLFDPIKQDACMLTAPFASPSGSC